MNSLYCASARIELAVPLWLALLASACSGETFDCKGSACFVPTIRITAQRIIDIDE